MGLLDVLLRKVIQIAGVSKPERKYINFVSGATAADNPTTGATDITISGGSAISPGTKGYVYSTADAGAGAAVTWALRDLPALNSTTTGSTNNVATTDANGNPAGAWHWDDAGANADRTVTGFAGGTNNRRLVVYNDATANNRTLTLSGGDAASSSANQIQLPDQASSLVIPAANAVVLAYESSLSLWVVVAQTMIKKSSGTSGQIDASDGVGGWTALTNVRGGAGFISVGASPVAAAGAMRFPSQTATLMAFRDGGNTADFSIIKCTPTTLTFGDTGAAFGGTTLDASSNGTATVHGYNISLSAANAVGIDMGAGGNYGLNVSSTVIGAALPVIGYAAASSPYAVHGTGSQAMADANQAPSASVYCFNTIKTTGALTANRNLTLPAATDAAAYTKIINNTCSGAFGVVVKDSGAGTTITVANGKTAIILMDSRGATRMTADV
jgi:hypothetical protein